VARGVGGCWGNSQGPLAAQLLALLALPAPAPAAPAHAHAHLRRDEDEDAAVEGLGLVVHRRVDLHQELQLLAGGAAPELLGQRQLHRVQPCLRQGSAWA
jgi:hypothetical protein